MAQKKITDLQPIEAVAETISIPCDDSIQTYRVTAAQLRDFILATESVVREKIAVVERIPTGAIFPFVAAAAPDGYLLCNGAAVSRTTYAALYAVIGDTHGNGNGSTTFNVPDYRGRFLRGVDGGAARDPDRATRTAMATGGNTGDNVGSVQADAYLNHTHADNLAAPAHTHTIAHTHLSLGTRSFGGQTSSLPATTENNSNYVRGDSSGYDLNTGASSAANSGAASATALTGAVSTSTTGSTETRPENANVTYIIKV